MRFTRNLEARSQADLLRHLEEAPFAWLFSADEAALQATPLPLLADIDAAGEVVSLTGHIARANPHVGRLRSRPRALAVFLGPNGYISPSWCRNRKQAPSWNYVASQFTVDVEFLEDETFMHDALQRLVVRMEQGRPEPWSIPELAERYQRLRRGIVGLRAHVVAANTKFKLGQGESPDVFADQVAGLEAGGEAALVGWMQRYRLLEVRERRTWQPDLKHRNE